METIGRTQEEIMASIMASKKLIRENNKMARELGFPRGVKQMIEEGIL